MFVFFLMNMMKYFQADGNTAEVRPNIVKNHIAIDYLIRSNLPST